MLSPAIRKAITAAAVAALALPLNPAAPAVGAPATASVAAESPQVPTFTFTGSGFGHGIGMSQYGAQGFALKGFRHDRILAHYYNGTRLERMPRTDARVNIDDAYRPGRPYEGRPSWTMRGVGGGLTLVAGGRETAVPEGEAVAFALRGGGVEARLDGGEPSSGDEVGVVPRRGALIQVAGVTGPFGWRDVRYRGEMRVMPAGAGLQAVNVLDMEEYLYAVVPRESPSSFEMEALKAQAVAARSYAYADVTAGNVLACSVYSQVYGGRSRASGGKIELNEAERTTRAVDATERLVLKAGDEVVKAYFYSQSGGHTADIRDVWPESPADPVFRAVEDPYEAVAGAKYSPWPTDRRVRLDGRALAAKLREADEAVPPDAHVIGMVVDRAESGHARSVTFKLSDGGRAAVAGERVRFALGLLSTRFYVSGFPIYSAQAADRSSASAEEVRRVEGARLAVLAGERDVAGALVAAGLAGALDAPLLLTPAGALGGAVREQLDRLKPQRLYVVGGVDAVSAATLDAAERASGGGAVRVSGRDRYDLAARAAYLARRAGEPEGVVLTDDRTLVSSGALAALAYSRGYPVLIARPEGLDGMTLFHLADVKPATVILAGLDRDASERLNAVVGGTSGREADERRGEDVYHLAVKLAEGLTEGGRTAGGRRGGAGRSAYLVTTADPVIGIVAGVRAARGGDPLLLAPDGQVAAPTDAYLAEHRMEIDRIVVFGGRGAVSESGASGIDEVMMN
ncbi:MAG: SpoIID/LytB domain-containing protein [Coriobacteriia bacterium]|nr:SpoIID/LytB domain-containing protein [Coriobacteriia bacterium]